MNGKRDFFTTFREGSERLTMQPSTQAWRKLNRRLDGQMRHSRIILMWWVATAAAVLVLVCGVYFKYSFGKTEDNWVETGPAPNHLQDLAPSKGCNPYCLLLESRKKLPASYTSATQKRHQ